MDTFFHPMLTEETHLPFYVKCIGGLKNQEHIRRFYEFPDYQWIHCTKGEGRFIIDQKEFLISPNTGMFIASHVPHEYYAIKEPWETHFVAFSGYGVPRLLDALGLKNYAVFKLDDIRYLDSILTDIFTISKSNTISAAFKNSSNLYNLLLEVKNALRENSNNIENARFKKLQPVIDYLQENYDKDISIDDMARIISVSPQSLCRLFAQTLNMRPFIYLNKLRIQKAKEILISCKEESIGDICKRVGYRDQSYFCATFKKIEGFTPTEYRNIYSI
jgi:AraC family transcriptional regulator of arabinose operon